jgi:hypothetical protein
LNSEKIWKTWKKSQVNTFLLCFPCLFTIQVTFLPYFTYLFTFQLTFLPYFPYL